MSVVTKLSKDIAHNATALATGALSGMWLLLSGRHRELHSLRRASQTQKPS